MAEEHVVVHLACDEGIGTFGDSLIQHEITSPTADGHLAYRPLLQFVTMCTSHAKALLYQRDEGPGIHRIRQFCKDEGYFFSGRTAEHRVGALRRVWGLRFTCWHGPQFFCDFVVHAPLGIIHIGMHGDDADVVLDGLSDGALHVVRIAHLLQSTEQQRVVAHHQVASFGDGLVDDLFSHVQTQ